MLESGFYNMDCMEGMKEFPDGFFDLAIVDPPYGINAPKMSMGSCPNRKDKHGSGISAAERLRKERGRLNQGPGKLKGRILNQSDCSWDTNPPKEDYFRELMRVSKNQIIWGGNYFPLPPTRCIVVWDKVQSWENFSQVEIAWTSFDRPAKIFRMGNCGAGKIHPTQKPVELYQFLLGKFAGGGMRILDTHVGSASSLIACRKAGFPYWGFEIDKGYYESARERLAREEAQVNVFDMIGDITEDIITGA